MLWIKYQIEQSTVGEETILVDKKVGYNNENLAIAEREAYNGYEIIEDDKSFDKQPLSIEEGGTGATSVEGVIENLGLGDLGGEEILTGTEAPTLATEGFYGQRYIVENKACYVCLGYLTNGTEKKYIWKNLTKSRSVGSPAIITTTQAWDITTVGLEVGDVVTVAVVSGGNGGQGGSGTSIYAYRGKDGGAAGKAGMSGEKRTSSGDYYFNGYGGGAGKGYGCGGGGGGAGRATGGNGGNAGGCVVSQVLLESTTIAVTIGAGGSGGAGNTTASSSSGGQPGALGGVGGSSSFGNYITVAGGTGAAGGAGGAGKRFDVGERDGTYPCYNIYGGGGGGGGGGWYYVENTTELTSYGAGYAGESCVTDNSKQHAGGAGGGGLTGDCPESDGSGNGVVYVWF